MPTLEELENKVWPAIDFESHLVVTCHRLRKKPIEDFTTEDLRIMIGQNIGLQFLMPKAITVLEDDPLADGDFYLGDLLKNVTSVNSSFLDRSPELLARIVLVTKRAMDLLQSSPFRNDADLFKAFQRFTDKYAT
ncbi:MAG: contact-dependent growth inhibition system immunity protein [Planctomycetota bacterium]